VLVKHAWAQATSSHQNSIAIDLPIMHFPALRRLRTQTLHTPLNEEVARPIMINVSTIRHVAMLCPLGVTLLRAAKRDLRKAAECSFGK
jgi:hypothetical protein